MMTRSIHRFGLASNSFQTRTPIVFCNPLSIHNATEYTIFGIKPSQAFAALYDSTDVELILAMLLLIRHSMGLHHGFLSICGWYLFIQ